MQARVQAAAAANTKAEKDSDNNKGLLVAGAGAAAVALVGYLVYRAFSSPAAKKKSKKKSKKRSKGAGKKVNVSLSTLLKIFDDISVSMKQMMLGFAQYEQKIRKEYKGKASEAEIVEHLNQMFLGELSKVEKGVYSAMAIVRKMSSCLGLLQKGARVREARGRPAPNVLSNEQQRVVEANKGAGGV